MRALIGWDLGRTISGALGLHVVDVAAEGMGAAVSPAA